MRHFMHMVALSSLALMLWFGLGIGLSIYHNKTTGCNSGNLNPLKVLECEACKE